MRSSDVARLDRALVQLRRLWSSPSHVFEASERRVEMSSLLLLEAWAQLTDPDRDDGAVSLTAVRTFAGVQPSTMSRLLDRAVTAGLMTRVASTGDKRHWYVLATTAGRAVREQAVLLRRSWLRALLDQWPHEDVTAFAALLDRFAGQVQRDGGPEAHRGRVDGARPGSPTLSGTR